MDDGDYGDGDIGNSLAGLDQLVEDIETIKLEYHHHQQQQKYMRKAGKYCKEGGGGKGG